MINNMPEVTYLRAWTRLRIAEARERSRDEQGLGVAEWVILVSIVAAAAIAIATLVMNRFREKANTIPTE
jgi:hypothetical protein